MMNYENNKMNKNVFVCKFTTVDYQNLSIYIYESIVTLVVNRGIILVS